MEEEITQAVKNNIVRRSFRSLVPKNPFRSIHVPSSSSKFIDEALSLRPVVSAFAPLAAASAPRPDNSPSNPRGGKGAAERERRRERSAHPRPGTGVGAEIFPWRFEAFCQGCKSGPASRAERDERGRGWTVDGERKGRSWFSTAGSRVACVGLLLLSNRSMVARRFDSGYSESQPDMKLTWLDFEKEEKEWGRIKC